MFFQLIQEYVVRQQKIEYNVPAIAKGYSGLAIHSAHVSNRSSELQLPLSTPFFLFQYSKSDTMKHGHRHFIPTQIPFPMATECTDPQQLSLATLEVSATYQSFQGTISTPKISDPSSLSNRAPPAGEEAGAGQWWLQCGGRQEKVFVW